MIKVPFDAPNHGESTRGQILSAKELESTLDNAYKNMPWFKFLADHATEVKVVDITYSRQTHITTHWVGFELDGKYETLYRLKYEV